MQISQVPSGHQWIPTRGEALRRMQSFVPRAGRMYAAERNYDRGSAQRTNVSTLSPYIRHRAVTEVELLQAVLSRFSLSSAEKFVQEIFWRTYWKGWLQAHPTAWSRYRDTLSERIAELERMPERKIAYADAIGGRTGIDAFDAWATELVSENYLHNHARMWFASIWIFTLRLPWELGADFFMRNLLDGDPASNTLSWRWVAGLHTRGKTYTATRDNIRRYTENRFELEASLSRSATALEDLMIPSAAQPAIPAVGLSNEPSLLVLHEDDLYGDLRDLPAAGVRGVCAVRATQARSPQLMNPSVVAFSDALAAESVFRAAAHASATDLGLMTADARADQIGELRSAAATCGATRVIAPFAPVGPARDILDRVRAGLDGTELSYAEFERHYDAASWPAATRGFFNLRSRIPTILAEVGIGAG